MASPLIWLAFFCRHAATANGPFNLGGAARYLVSDGWDCLLRGVRRTLEQRRDILRSMVMRFFPEGTRCSQSTGGYVL